METRILKSCDVHLLDKFLEESNSLHRIGESEKNAWLWYRTLLNEERKGVILFASIIEGKLDTVFCSFAADVLYNHKYKIIPFWVSGLVRSVNISSKIPGVKIDNLVAPVVLMYEQHGYKTSYAVRDVPINLNYQNIEKYIERVQNKNILSSRYNTYLDRFIDNPNTYYEFDLFKLIIPTSVPPGRKIAIFRYDLKYEFCKL